RLEILRKSGLFPVLLWFSHRLGFLGWRQCLFRHALSAFHSCPLEIFQGASRGLLLRLFFCAACASRQALPVNPHLDLESLLMIGPALSRQTMLRRRLSAPLEKFLQRRFVIRFRDAFAALLKRLLKQIPLQQLPRGIEPRIQVNASHHGFERIREQRLLLASAGFFFAAPE